MSRRGEPGAGQDAKLRVAPVARLRGRAGGKAADLGELCHMRLVALGVAGVICRLGGAEVAARPVLRDPERLLE